MADRAALRPTGRRVRGYISDLIELSGRNSLWTAVVYHEDYRSDAALAGVVAEIGAFLESPMVTGLPAAARLGPGVFAFRTGEVRCARELIGASPDGIGWRAAMTVLSGALRILAAASEQNGAPPLHGSIDPHRLLVSYDGAVQLIGFGLPRLDLLDFMDDASLLPEAESLLYTAPESLDAETQGEDEDASSDLFCLALIAAHLATGRPLYPQGTAKSTITAAAEGEGRAALEKTDAPDAVKSTLGKMLEPWSDQRFSTTREALAAIEAVSVEGDALDAVMEALAETASDVEFDLPEDWSLPVEETSTPSDAADAEALQAARDRAEGHARAAEAEASTVRERVSAGRPWETDSSAQAAIAEARAHADAVDRAAAEARSAANEAAEASLERAEQQAAIAEDAVTRARGAAHEAVRTLDKAIRALDAAEAKRRLDREAEAAAEQERQALAGRVAVLEKTLDRLRKLGTRAEAIGEEAGVRDDGTDDIHGPLSEALVAIQHEVDEAEAERSPPLTDAAVTAAERLVHARHASIQQTLERAEELARSLAARRSELAVERAERDAARKALEALGEEARAIAASAEAAVHDFRPEHPDDRQVASALKSARRAASDAQSSAEEVERIELEPEDDPTVVLDAAETHLDAAKGSNARCEAALERAREADSAARAAFEEARAARASALENHRADLARAGKRILDARDRVDAARDTLFGESAELDEPQVMAARGSLLTLAERLEARAVQFQALDEESRGTDDPEEVETLLHTATAEAEFADGDLTELPDLVAGLRAAILAAQTARDTAEKARRDALAAVEHAIEVATRAQTAIASLAQDDPLPSGLRDDVRSAPRATELADVFGEAVAETALAAQQAIDAGGRLRKDPSDAAAVVDLQELAERASTTGERAQAAHTELKTWVAERVRALEADEKAHAEALDRTRTVLGRLQEVLQATDRSRPVVEDPAVAERIVDPLQALNDALDEEPERVEPSVEDDPLAALELLRPALASAESWSKRVDKSRTAFERALTKAEELVDALREAFARGEAAADRAAAASAETNRLLEGLQGDWPGVQDARDQLERSIEAADQAAARASAASESIGDAKTKATANKRAKAAEKAATEAEAALEEARPRAGRLAELVEAAQAEIAEVARQRREEALEATRRLIHEASRHRLALESALERAGTALADTPSARAHAAWADADPVIDGALDILARLDGLLARAEQSTDPDATEAHRVDAEAALRALDTQVVRAVDLATKAIDAAESEAQANADLADQLAERVTDVETRAAALAQIVERCEAVGEIDDPTLQDLIRNLQTQARHCDEALAEARDAARQSHGAPDAEARDAIEAAAHAAVKRATAAQNTAAALAERVDKALAAYEARRDAERQAIVDEGLEAVHKLGHGSPATDRITPFEPREDWPETTEELATLETALGALKDADAALGLGLQALEDAESPEHAREARAELGQLMGTWESARDAAEAAETQLANARQSAAADRQAAHQAALDAHQRSLEQASASMSRVEVATRTLRQDVESFRELLADSAARGVAEAWKEALERVEQADELAVKAQEHRDALPSAPPEDPEGFEAALSELDGFATTIEALVAGLESFLAPAVGTARALAGILDDANGVRDRYTALLTQLDEAKSALAEAIIDAEKPGTLDLHERAQGQFEELDQSLVEAAASLEELNDADDADEAAALLEVTAASIDIAASVFELEMPLVERALKAARTERDERLARAAAIEAAQSRRQTAAALPEFDEAPLVQLRSDAEGYDEIEAALEAVGAAHTAQVASRASLEAAVATPIAETVDEANAAAEAAEAARLEWEMAAEALVQRIGEARAALDQAKEAREARRIQLEEAARTLARNRETLRSRVDAANDGVEAAREAAEAQPLATEESWNALLAARDAITALDMADSAEGDALVQAAAASTAMLESVDHDYAALSTAVLDAAEAATRAQEAEAQALEAARARFEALATAWKDRLAAREQASAAADAMAADYPLEAGEALRALEEASENWPEPPLELPDESTAAGRVCDALEAAVRVANDTDFDVLLAAIQAAVKAAEAEEAEREAAVADAGATLVAIRDTLAERQRQARALLESHSAARELPEAESAFRALEELVEQFGQRRIDATPPSEFSRIAAVLTQAETAAERDPDIDRLAADVESAVQRAHETRSAARSRLVGAREMVETAIETLTWDGPLPDAPPVQAALGAIRDALSHIRSFELPEEPGPDTPTRALKALAEQAEAAASEALRVDARGLYEELREAVARAEAEAAKRQAERETAAADAIKAIETAGRKVTESLEDGRASFDSLPEVPDTRTGAKKHRSAARDALESAAAALRNLADLKRRAHDGDLDVDAAVDTAKEAEHTATVIKGHIDAANEAMLLCQDELDGMDRLLADVPPVMERVRSEASSARATATDAPDPVGHEAFDAYVRASECADKAEAALGDAQGVAEELEAAGGLVEAAPLLARLTQIAEDTRRLAEEGRKQAEIVREQSEAEAQREAAAREEAMAAARERAELAAERAQESLERLGQIFAEAGAELAPHREDPAISEALTVIATANDRALQASDDARLSANRAQRAESEEVAAHAVQCADAAGEALEQARSALESARARIAEIAQEQAVAERARAFQQQAENDKANALLNLRERVEHVRSRIEVVQSSLGEPVDDDLVTHARERLEGALTTTRTALAQAEDQLGMLETARWEDVPAFIADATREVDDTEAAVGLCEAAARDHRAERDASHGRRADLLLEEHRGRAWEACRVAQQLSARLAASRSALPELPEHPTAELRSALDRLAEVERRLWRAGQRADEARERAGRIDDLDEVIDAADIAEKSIGTARQWETEMDAALEAVTATVRGLTAAIENPRMRRLRRGRLEAGQRHTPLPVPERQEEPTSRTEALLQRLRKGKKSGETGRERLRRLREQRRAAPQSLAPMDSPPEDGATNLNTEEFGGVEDFEALRPTTLGKDAQTDRRSLLLERLKRRRKDTPEPAPPRVDPMLEEEPSTQMFSVTPGMKASQEDAKTAVFTREMLDELAGQLTGDDEE